MQKTIKRTVRLEGMGITGEGSTGVTIQPAPPDTGLVFIREDLPGQPQILCQPEFTRVDFRWTSLVNEQMRIEHTEHLLAAIAGLGLDNLIICLSSPYIPVVSDFSSQYFVELLLQAEPVAQAAAKQYYLVRESLQVVNSFYDNDVRYDRVLMAIPAPQLTLTYLLDFPDKKIPTQLAHFVFDQSMDFTTELAPARSFIMESEYETVAGLIGQGIDNCLVIPQGVQAFQWVNEPARHKALDLLGDIATLGRPIKGHFIGLRTGHKDNIQMCKKLRELLGGSCLDCPR